MQKSTINKVEVAGYVGRDAEQKSERAPVRFSVATGGDNKADGSGKWPLAWHNITCWDSIPDAIGVKKGDYVRALGRLNYSQWETSDGQKRTAVEVVAYKLILENSGSSGGIEAARAVLAPAIKQRNTVVAKSESWQDVITDEHILF